MTNPTPRFGPIAIAQAAAGHIDAIHALEISCFPAPWRREFFESELHASGRLNLVALRGPQVIGYLFAMWFFDEMHINKIAVAEQERRRGVALALMEKCIEFAELHRIRVLSLEVRQSNRAAQDFYTRLEFGPSYVRPKYYPDGESAVVMSRILE